MMVDLGVQLLAACLANTLREEIIHSSERSALRCRFRVERENVLRDLGMHRNGNHIAREGTAQDLAVRGSVSIEGVVNGEDLAVRASRVRKIARELLRCGNRGQGSGGIALPVRFKKGEEEGPVFAIVDPGQ